MTTKILKVPRSLLFSSGTEHLPLPTPVLPCSIYAPVVTVLETSLQVMIHTHTHSLLSATTGKENFSLPQTLLPSNPYK